MTITGKASKYGDDVSTDLIFPGRYTYMLLTDEQMAQHALEDLDAGFAGRDVTGGIIVAGANWGCGSAREQAVKCLRAKGIRAVIAKSIARIYYRNCINEGLIPIVCPEAAESLENGDELRINVENAEISSRGKKFRFAELPPFVSDIIRCGGLIESVRREVAGNKEFTGKEE